MYAVIKTGGKQYTVRQGDSLKVEKLDLAEGEAIEFAPLMLGNGDEISIGAPSVEGATVSAEVASHGRAKKIEIIKFRRRKHHRKQMGHRQSYTELTITGISAG